MSSLLSWFWGKPKVCYNIEAFINCSRLHEALSAASDVQQSANGTNTTFEADVRTHPHLWERRLLELEQSLKASPEFGGAVIYSGCHPGEYKLVGGVSEFLQLVQKLYRVSPRA